MTSKTSGTGLCRVRLVGTNGGSCHPSCSLPQSGRPTVHADIREIIEPSYGFVIPYTIRGNVVWVLRVYNARRHPLIWTDDGLT